jgi:hypothetical protein
MEFLNFLKILGVLAKHEVDFIVIGGVSGALRGAPLSTFDVDVVHSRTPENIVKLLSALEELDAYYRFQPERKFRPNGSHLSSPGHQLLTTSFGKADFLGSITRQRTYEDLLPEATEMEIAGGYIVKVLKLEMLIKLKEEMGQPKDLAHLIILRSTLAEIRRREAQKTSAPNTGKR